jgi:transcriptional antiterminator RfaH
MRRWYVVHTHPGGEIRASVNLERQGYEIYLPRCRKWRRHARRTEIVAAPLFPRYLFVSLDVERDRWRPVLSTFGVCGLISRGGMPAAVPEGIVESIKGHEDADRFVNVARQVAFQRGDSLQITAGPFVNHVARFEGLGGEQRVIVLLELLGRQLRVLVPSEAIAASA